MEELVEMILASSDCGWGSRGVRRQGGAEAFCSSMHQGILVLFLGKSII